MLRGSASNSPSISFRLNTPCELSVGRNHVKPLPGVGQCDLDCGGYAAYSISKLFPLWAATPTLTASLQLIEDRSLVPCTLDLNIHGRLVRLVLFYFSRKTIAYSVNLSLDNWSDQKALGAVEKAHASLLFKSPCEKPSAIGGFPSFAVSMTRATGITAYLENGGMIENAQAIAGHESPATDEAVRSDRR